MTWTRPEHAAVEAVLAALDARLLRETRFFFGGGTRIVLEFDEYRLSRDVDILGSDHAGYARLRSLVREKGARALFAAEPPGGLTDVRADQYGIRFAVRSPIPAGDLAGDLKVEFVLEGRIELDSPVQPDWCPLPCLAIPDCFAEKLLANSDRWADRHVCAPGPDRPRSASGSNRADPRRGFGGGGAVCDVAPMGPSPGSPRRRNPDGAWTRVERAYGAGVRDDLRRALDQFRELPGFADTCARRLALSEPVVLDRGIELLFRDME